jgi:radical SAM protein with 4Fe4S-binding SPASM domain
MSRITHVGWSLGNYCNARCAHCYSWQLRKSPRALSWPEARRILDELACNGVRTVNLGGNEPIFTHGPQAQRSMLPQIVRAATDLGLVVGVTTNGTSALLLEELDAGAFRRVHEWHVSLDSPFPEEHDRNRGGRYFELSMRALARMRERGARRTIIYTVMSCNSSDAHVEALFRLALETGADVRINTLKPTEPEHQGLVPTPKQYFRFFREVARWSEPTVLGESPLAALWGLPSEGCPCGTTSLRIHSVTEQGTVPVSPCVFLHQLKVGDLLTEPLSQLVQRPEFLALQRRREQAPAQCRERSCPLIEACHGGCAAHAVLQEPAVPMSAALERPDPFCPEEALRLGNPDAAPLPCAIEVLHEGIRVHEGYLCTYIGRPRPAAAWEGGGAAPCSSAQGAVARPQNTLPASAWR